MKIYHKNALTRFFYWPKTILVGNTFYYRVPEEDTDYADRRKPSANWIKKLISIVIFPLFNPIAFLLNYFNTTAIVLLQDHPDIILHTNPELRKQTSNVYKKEIIACLEENNIENSYEEFRATEAAIWEKYTNWSKKMDTVEQWDNVENINEFNEMFMASVKNFPLIIKAIREKINLEKISTPQSVAEVITSQQNRDTGFCFPFIHSTLINLYHLARSKAIVQKDGCPKPSEKHNVEKFYTKDTPPYKWRQGYNTNIKLFFSEFGGQKQFRPALRAADPRFDRWTQIDTSKDESFSTYPDTKPT